MDDKPGFYYYNGNAKIIADPNLAWVIAEEENKARLLEETLRDNLNPVQKRELELMALLEKEYPFALKSGVDAKGRPYLTTVRDQNFHDDKHAEGLLLFTINGAAFIRSGHPDIPTDRIDTTTITDKITGIERRPEKITVAVLSDNETDIKDTVALVHYCDWAKKSHIQMIGGNLASINKREQVLRENLSPEIIFGKLKAVSGQ